MIEWAVIIGYLVVNALVCGFLFWLIFKDIPKENENSEV